MSDEAPSVPVPPPHVRAILGMIGTLAVIENRSTDDVAKVSATIALDAARGLSPELRPLVDGIRTTLK